MNNKRYAPQMESTKVLIESVDGDTCTAYDILHGQMRVVASGTPSGLTPLVGDIWAISRDDGPWGLSACIERAPVVGGGTIQSVLDRLSQLGLIKWDPDARFPSQSAHLAYVGEIRLFHINVHPAGWLVCNGVLVPISRWRRLFREISNIHGGDGLTTFATPTIAAPHVSSHWLMCAE
jgi:hypothetical protein